MNGTLKSSFNFRTPYFSLSLLNLLYGGNRNKRTNSNLLKAELIKESCSTHFAPVTLMLKREEGKKTRFCADFCKLNRITKTDAEPLPWIDILLDKLAKAKFFSTLHLISGYWHIPIYHKNDILTIFLTKFFQKA